MSQVAAGIQRLDHIGLAVPSVEEAVELFVDTLGATFLTGGDNRETGLRLAQFKLGGFKIELMESLREDSILAPAMAARGPGFHHVTFLVDDVLTTASGLDASGYPTTGTDTTSANWSETFIRPGDTFGALLQFVATARDWSTPVEHFSLEDVLDGRIVWNDFVPCWREDVDETVPR